MKYFFFDIDGTLSTSLNNLPQIPKSTKLALQKLKDDGHFLAIATGRSYSMAKAYLDQYDFENMVCDGGNSIVINRKLVQCKPLDHQLCIELIEECKKKNIIWTFSPENAPYRLAPDTRFLDYTKDTYLETRIIKGLDPNEYDNIFKLYIAGDVGIEDELETLKKLPYLRYGPYIFVESDDKAVGIKTIMDHYHADYHDVVVFGDGKNDLKMFSEDWTSIAMGNAVDELKEIATFVTSDVDDDGIYNACEHFNWWKSSF